MHDGSIKTLGEVVDHYGNGGRTIKTGPNAGVGAENLNKSEFVKGFDLSPQEKEDLVAFLKSLTDRSLLTDPAFSNPFVPAPARTSVRVPTYEVHGQVVRVYLDAGAVTLYHDEIPGLMQASKAPFAMAFVVADKERLKGLRPGQNVIATVRRQGSDYVLENLRPRAFAVSQGMEERKRP